MTDQPPRDPAWLAQAQDCFDKHVRYSSHTGYREAVCEAFATLLAAVDTAAREDERAACIEIADLQSFYPDTHTGMRQKWVKEQIVEKIRSRPKTFQTRPTAPAPFPVSGEVRLSDLSQAFIDGAREARRNPSATDAQIVRASDGYVKLILKRQQDATAPARREDG